MKGQKNSFPGLVLFLFTFILISCSSGIGQNTHSEQSFGDYWCLQQTIIVEINALSLRKWKINVQVQIGLNESK